MTLYQRIQAAHGLVHELEERLDKIYYERERGARVHAHHCAWRALIQDIEQLAQHEGLNEFE